MALPDCIRLLQGDGLLDAKRIVNGVAPALYRGNKRRDAELAEYTRVVYDSGGFDQTSDAHLRALAQGAHAIGESTAFVCDQVTTAQAGRNTHDRFAALEVDLIDLAEYVASTSWNDATVESWPEEAAAIATPIFVDDWAVTSTNGTWCWIDIQVMEDCKLTAPAELLAGYKAAHPRVVIDPIRFLHSDGHELISENGGAAYTTAARNYFEPMYGVAGAQRLWEIYEASAIEDKWYRSWDAKERLFTAARDADPQLRIDLEAIWDGTYVG